MISKYKAYWMILKETHTPFIFLLDNEYLPMTTTSIVEFLEQIKNLQYVPNIMDCDNFAFVLKGFADTKGNSMGIVYGKYRGTAHCWNIALLGYNTIQIEPQEGLVINRYLYHPWVVII